MQTLQAVIMGAFQGLTEFLPVSSSGHIVITSALYKLITGANVQYVNQEEIFFDILIHLATLFAVLIYFFDKIKKIFLGFVKSAVTKKFENEEFKYGAYIIAATFITGVFGLIIKDFAHELTKNPVIVSLLIMATGLILFISEKIKTEDKKMNIKTALIVGLFQGFAILPGISRSGMTISSAMMNGVKRVNAAEFSFILSVPVIILASLIYPLISFDLSQVKSFNITAMALGMLTSFIIGYICIKGFMKFVEKCTLKGFSYYCFIIGAISAIVFAIFS